MARRSRTEHGFTLMELMIVVAILGFLMTIAVPYWVRYRERAEQDVCISNLRQIQQAIQTWAVENRKANEDVVSYQDIRRYLRCRVACPAGGATFAESYRLTVVSNAPVCLLRPAAHLAP